MFIDVCNRTKECFSVYRIEDEMNEAEINRKLVLKTCLKMQRHRFRCSSEQPLCLSVISYLL